MSALSKNSAVAIIGTGAMGAGIAQVVAQAGHPVRLFDQRPGAAQAAIEGIKAQWQKQVDKGRMKADEAKAAGERLSVAETLEGLAGVSLVVEAIVEDLKAKQALFSRLEGIVAPDCLFGTNTSSISITAIGAALTHPERLAGLHFFNPAPLMALVEIVSGLATSPDVANTLFDSAASWGKTPVKALSTPGFIVNRVARPYYAEALRVAHEGGADCATLDACCREAGGFRMGPFELMDLIGNDVNFAVTQSVWKAFYHDPRFLPSLIQQERVDAGFYGRKSGRGFYDYREGAAKPEPATQPLQPFPEAVTLYGTSKAALALRSRLTKAGCAFSVEDAQEDGRIAHIGATVLYATDGRTATRRAFEQGAPDTVLMDLALDYEKATRIAVSIAHQASPAALQAITGLLQAAGFAVSVLADVPGLIVMRTVAMLANEAADAVNQGVCSVQAVDQAMRLGVNYPLGPLTWADQLGPQTLMQVLTHLGQSYGEDRYRISPHIAQTVFAGRLFHD
jgi:3-hydroxybutyryl-CoA dehydrogenase